MGKKKVLYLDQFAVSNMYNANPTSTWGELCSIIIEKIKEGILSCPMPLEHLYETLGRSNIDECGKICKEYSNKISQQHKFFNDLANAKAFYGLEEIASKEIMMLLRHGKIPLWKSIYIHEVSNNVLDIMDIYEKGHAFNVENHKYFQDLSNKVNAIREAIKTSYTEQEAKVKTANYVDMKSIMDIEVSKYIDGLKKFYDKEHVIIHGVRCGSFVQPSKVDLLIYKLCDEKIDKKSTHRLIHELETHGFDRIPSMYIRSLLNADIIINNKVQTPNDEIDLDRAAIGLRISDYFFADNDKKITIEKYQLDTKYHTKVYSAKKQSLLYLKEELATL